MRRAVFLDRDGVINRAVVRHGKPYPPSRPDQVEILSGVSSALERLRDAGFLLIVVTNQPDVARGSASLAQVDAINRRLGETLPIDEFRVCCHDDRDDCSCRKPRPGLILEAAGRLQIDLGKSYMVGDRWRDIEAGRSAGCRTVFLDYGCVKALPAATREALRELTRGALDRDPAVVRDAAQRLGLLQEGAEGTAVVSAFSHLFAPFRRDAVEPFPPVLTGPALRAAAGPAASLSAVRRDLRVPAGLPFVNRTVVGMYSVLARLGAVANWHRIAREYAFGEPPSTELGEAERAWQERRRA